MIYTDVSLFLGLISILIVLFFIALGCIHAYKKIGRKRDLVISVCVFSLFLTDFFAIFYFATVG